MNDQARQLGEALWRILSPTDEERVYAVLDGARDGALASEALRLGMRVRMLLVGPTAMHLTDVAPYLVAMRHPALRTRWARSWGAAAGILLVLPAEMDFDAVWAHARELFVARDEDGAQVFFRYYDPRVLRLYLPTCTGEEAKEFFGPARRLLVEAEDPAAALLCTVGAGGVEMRTVSTGAGGAGPAPGAEAGAGR